MSEIHLILDELNDGQQQLSVAQPAEDVFEGGEILVGHALGNAVAEGRQDDARNLRLRVLDATGDVENVVVVCARHHDDEVEGELLHLPQRLFLGRHLDEAWRVAEA